MLLQSSDQESRTKENTNLIGRHEDPLPIRIDRASKFLGRFGPKNSSVQAQISMSNPQRNHSRLPDPLPTRKSQKQLILIAQTGLWRTPHRWRL